MRISATGTWSKTHGFTLVELAVVLVILGIAVTLVLPRLANLGQNNLRASGQRLAITIKSLYNEAALSGETHLLVLQIDRSRFAVHRLVNKGDVVEEQQVGEERELSDGVRFRDVTVKGQGTLRSGEIKLHAYPVGWMDESTIHLSGDRGQVLTLHIPPLAGMAEVFDDDRDF